ncbi:MAG: hypothetical protein ACI9FR_001418 [Cryomorphaceae bacterium]|jgi:hypothetical protein
MITKSHQAFRSFKTQQGWTFWGLLFVMNVILFFSYVGMQLVPVYSANQNIKNSMNLAVDNSDLRRVNRFQIIKAMQAQLYLDGSHQLLNYKTDLKVLRSTKQFVVETHYNREIPLFYNLSLKAKFDNVVERDLAER